MGDGNPPSAVVMPQFFTEGWSFETSEPSAAIADAVERDEIEKKLPSHRRWIPDMVFSGEAKCLIGLVIPSVDRCSFDYRTVGCDLTII